MCLGESFSVWHQLIFMCPWPQERLGRFDSQSLPLIIHFCTSWRERGRHFWQPLLLGISRPWNPGVFLNKRSLDIPKGAECSLFFSVDMRGFDWFQDDTRLLRLCEEVLHVHRLAFRQPVLSPWLPAKPPSSPLSTCGRLVKAGLSWK